MDTILTKGKIHFEWNKVPFLLPLQKVRLFVNDLELPSLSFTHDSRFELPIPGECVTVKLKCFPRSKTKTVILNPNENYVCKLSYSRITGNLKIEFFSCVSVNVPTMVKIN